MRNIVSGTVRDEDGNTVPGATVFVSDANGKIATTKARVRTDNDGKYTLPVSFPFINPLTGSVTIMPIGTHLTTKYANYPDVRSKIDFSSEEPLNIEMIMRFSEQQEVTVTADPKEVSCIKNGGKFDRTTKTCTIPKKETPKPKVEIAVEEKTWWEKNKKIILIGGGSLLLASLLAAIVVISPKDTN